MDIEHISALLIEDNPDDALLMQAALEEANSYSLDLEWVERLSEGLERLSQGGIDVVFLDLSLPDAHGIETLARANAQAPTVPIVVLTGLDDEMLSVAALREGAQDYLVKGQADGDLLVRSMRYAIERKRAEETERLRKKEIEALFNVARILVQVGSLQEKSTRVLEEVAQVVNADWLALRLYDEQENVLRPLAMFGEGIEEIPPIPIIRPGQLLVGRAFAEGRAVVVNDYASYDRADPSRVAHGIKSAIGLPIRSGDRIVGTINVNAREAGHFTPERVRLLTAIADGMGVLLENASLLDAIQESEERYRTLFEQSRDAIFISTDGRITDVNQAALDLFGYTREEAIGIETRSVYVNTPDQDILRRELNEHGSVQDFETRLVKKDGAEIDCLVAMTRQRSQDGHSLCTQGIIHDITGRKRVEQQLRESLEEKQALLEEIQQLYRQERRRAEQMKVINDAAARVSSILSLDELLPYVANLIHDTFGHYNVNIGLIDPDSERLVFRAGVGGYEGEPPIGFSFEPDTGICPWVAQNGKALLANDVTREPRFYYVEDLKDTRAELAVPIIAGDRILGVVDIQSVELNAFDEADVSTAQTLANQLAVAIENAHLFQETRDMAVLEERNRMAREIHDTMAQGFTGIVLQLEAGEQALGEDPAEAQRHLSSARNLARECLQEARRSVWNLLPQSLEKRSLHDVLEEEVQRFASAGRESARFNLLGSRRELPSEVQVALLRICQESLTNIQRHAEATEVDVSLVYHPGKVNLSVRDNGKGFDPQEVKSRNRQEGFGLKGMRQRARLLGGALIVSSQKGQGAHIEVTIPTP